jgi:hypothetical protein
MPQDRPMEVKRARRGLGARTPEGTSFPAKPKSRIPRAVRGTRRRKRVLARPLVARGRPRGARVEHARHRTVRDNPEARS